jgi:hypothetical protein
VVDPDQRSEHASLFGDASAIDKLLCGPALEDVTRGIHPMPGGRLITEGFLSADPNGVRVGTLKLGG